MPRVVEIESLVKLCTDCIKKSIESSKFTADPSVMERDRDAITVNSELITSPFHQLPVPLLEEIIRTITSSQKPVDAKILHYLITSQIQHLRFSVYSEDYLILFPKLDRLLILELENTGVGNNCLLSIGSYCSALRSLNLKRCLKVTNTGIQWLCDGVDDPGMKIGKSGLCKTLQKLCIFGTSVTERGIQIALKQLRSLTILDNFGTLEALLQLSQAATDSNQAGFYNNMFSLSMLYIPPDRPYKSNSLQLALALCHSINHISIYVTKGFKDSDLLCLKSIKMLRKLKIYKSHLVVQNQIEITFDGGVAPLLKVFGKSLETLGLECLDLVRISSIIELCPNLNALYISDVTASLENEKDLFRIEKKLPIFRELKVLFCIYTIPVDILLFLLSSPSLENIGFSRCDALSDKVLLETVKRHQFQNLKKLKLEYCDSVTERGIDALLINSNPLECINLVSCKNLKVENCNDWLSLIVEKNWNLKIFLK